MVIHLLWLKFKREITLQIFNGAQKRAIEKCFKTEEHQLLFIQTLDSTAKILAIVTNISQPQSETSLHLYQNRCMLKLEMDQFQLRKKDQLDHHLKMFNGAPISTRDMFSLMEKLLLSDSQMPDITANKLNMKVTNQPMLKSVRIQSLEMLNGFQVSKIDMSSIQINHQPLLTSKDMVHSNIEYMYQMEVYQMEMLTLYQMEV